MESYRKRSSNIRYVKKESSSPAMETGSLTPMTPTNVMFDEEEFKTQFPGTMDFDDTLDPYFSSYSHFSIHEQMLKDSARTKSYMLACLCNKEQFKDAIVLDVGTGTGILAIFAVRAGAKFVYGIEKAEIADFVFIFLKLGATHSESKWIRRQNKNYKG